jgi:predicted transcriptional regulator
MPNPHSRFIASDTFASQLEKRRREIGLSVTELGKLAGYHDNTILRVLHGKNVHWHTLRDVANALGFTLNLKDAA